MRTIPTSDEKMIAALAHASVLFSFLGPIVPAILWSSQRQKSDYVRYHALQALGYQTFFYWFWIIGVFGIVFLTSLIIIPVSVLAERTQSNVGYVPFLIQPLMLILIFGIFGLYFLLGFAGALFCFLGREFHYPLFGRWLERYLAVDTEPSSGSINETREDNWVAGLCHATAILQMWGLALPLIVWITQKDRSARLKFQAIQSMAYQGLAFLGYLLWTMMYVLLLVAMFFTLIVGGVFSDGEEISGPVGFVFLIVFLMIMVIGIFASLLMPIYLLVALIGTVRVIRGNDFKYPILGNFIRRRLRMVET